MKIRVQVVASKVVEAPEFLRPYITGEKSWDEMDYEEVRLYCNWYEELAEKENILDDAKWSIEE